MEEEGRIEEVDAPPDEGASGGPPRRFYALTPAGRDSLARELRRMDDVVRYARRQDLIPEG
ncbi:MAG: hypothetical protein GWM92_20545 [Gemmatimonadetes bacterium]|nr:hypothetical protein [Gemmatimonadota bacterium]NIR81227.1 hypothetical protein [Gemmatimonadota bacterium]NIT90072.1 hypothetical protein [Gemmatimonadota bacterium]NIU33884.1 hypothetical protein [Gemmatimonadota bacterium]NIU38076.1 hypothetical protein [Gemmatimonadota bacterium]